MLARSILGLTLIGSFQTNWASQVAKFNFRALVLFFLTFLSTAEAKNYVEHERISVSPSDQLTIEGYVSSIAHNKDIFRPDFWTGITTIDKSGPLEEVSSSKAFFKISVNSPVSSGGLDQMDAEVQKRAFELCRQSLAGDAIRHFHITNGMGSYCVFKNPEVTKSIVGADPGEWDWTTIGVMRIGHYSLSIYGMSRGNNDAAEYKQMIALLENMTISRATKTEADAALLDAAYAGDLEGVKSSLEKGASLDATNYQGWTPLMYAAKMGHEDVALFLIEKGSDVNRRTRTKDGGTVLCDATEGGNLKIIQLLLKKGAEVNGKGKDGLMPLAVAVDENFTEAATLLISKGADVNLLFTRTDGNSDTFPLMTASCYGSVEMMSVLLTNGAKIDLTNKKGDTALIAAAKYPYPEAVRLLLKNKADVNAKGLRGHTALICAPYNGRVENLRILLNSGADLSATATDSDDPNDQQNRYGAADIAEQQGQFEALAVIRDAQSKRHRL
jgi:ankyrin repeat protein